METSPSVSSNGIDLESLTRCNLCGGSHFEIWLEKRGELTGHLFPIVECRDCGLLFVTPRLSEEGNRRLYDESYFNGKGFDASMNYVALESENDQLRDGENRGIIEKIQLLRPGLDARVLDVGCGTGSLLRAFDLAGYTDVWGLEFSEYSVKIAQGKSRAKVLCGDFLSLDFGDVKFDAINATEVVEHTRDPMGFFKKVSHLLKPGGVFVYTTGNADGLYARILGKRWPYLIPEGHLVYFRPRTIERYFAQAGLSSLRESDLPAKKRAELHRLDDQITHSQLEYLGQSDPGLKGRIFRLAGALTGGGLRRLVTQVVGKTALPIAIKPG